MKPNSSPPILLGAAMLFLTMAQAIVAADQKSSSDKQRELIAVLQSDAPPQDKAIPCKQLAIYGTKDAVPALAPLLADPELASWARIALEAIPGPEADEALRAALPKLSGVLLIGAINSIGVRRDATAVPALAGRLKDADKEIVAAAAVALGKIGGTEAARILHQALSSTSKPTLTDVAEGVILCAEGFLSGGKHPEAVRLYDAVRLADVPKQRWLEATRGAILARQTGGIPLLIEQLRSPSRAEFAMALRTARELEGRAVTEAIAAELDRAGSDHQVMLLLALSDRHDDSVLPKLLQVAGNGSKPARVAALSLLDRFGEVSAVPVLLQAAADADAEVAQPAKATLTRMEGKPVDAALLSRLPQSTGKTRQVIIELAELRRIEAAVPSLVPSAADGDPGIRRAALSALGALGSEPQAGDLVRLLSSSQDAAEREAIEGALTAVCGRVGAKCLPQVMPLTKNNDSELRIIALRALATIGGRDALTAVAAALDDAEESVQDEAVGTLATWPNNWPEDTAVAEPLLGLVKSDRKRSHQVQGTRGYLRYVQENKKLTNADKVKAMDQLLPCLKQAQEKRLAISTLSGIPAAPTLESLATLAGDPAVAEEACLALVNVATAKDLEGAGPEARRQALRTALEKSKSEATQKKASDALKAIP
jgi:HEAT repeat protein